MTDIFNAFKRDEQITFYKTAKTTISVFDPLYSSDFPNTYSGTETTQSQSFDARLWYLERQDLDHFIPGGDDAGIRGKFYYNRVRMQVGLEAFNYLKDTERFVFFDEIYQIEQGWQRIGMLDSFMFYEVVLIRVN